MICPECGTDFPGEMSNARVGKRVYCSGSCKDTALFHEALLIGLMDNSVHRRENLPSFVQRRLGYLPSRAAVDDALALLKRRGMVI